MKGYEKGLTLIYLLADKRELAFGVGEGVFGHFEVRLPAGYLIDGTRAAEQAEETPQLDFMDKMDSRVRLATDCLVRAMLLDERVRGGGVKAEWTPQGVEEGWGDLMITAARESRSKTALAEAFEGVADALDVLGIPTEERAAPGWRRGAWAEIRKFRTSNLRGALREKS